MFTTSIPRKLAITVFLVVALHGAPTGAQNFRYFSAVVSLVDDGRFEISERFWQYHPDFVAVGQARYPNMPPGMTLVLSPSYWLYAHTVGRLVSGSAVWYQSVFGVWAVATVNAPILALAAVLMFRLVNRIAGSSQKALWLTLGLLFGTPMFSYSTQLWSHPVSMALTLGIFYLIVEGGPAWAIGGVMGALIVTENHAPLAVGMLGLFWLWRVSHRRRHPGPLIGQVMWLVVAAAPFVAGQLWYNHAATGSMLGNTQVLWFQQNLPGQAIVVWPTLERIWGTTFSPFRGLFLYAPLTLLAAAGLVSGRSFSDPILRFCWVFVMGYYLLCIAFVQWSTGVSFGPRYFSSALPFALMTASVWPVATIRNWTLASIVINWAGATTTPTFNIFMNLGVFAYRGPFLESLDFLRMNMLPVCCNLSLHVVTPFWLYVALGGVLWVIWRPRPVARPAEG